MNKNGLSTVEILIIAGIIGMLASIAIPSFVKARNTANQMELDRDYKIRKEAYMEGYKKGIRDCYEIYLRNYPVKRD